MGNLKNEEWLHLTDTLAISIKRLIKHGVAPAVAFEILVETAIRQFRDAETFDPIFIRGNVRHALSMDKIEV